jgi:hypothetical protein
VSDNSSTSIPQDDSNGAVDFDELLREHSASGPDWTPPPDDTHANEDDAGETVPGYWRSQLHTLPAFLQRPRKQWRVDTVFGERDFVLLYGESGHGKTHVALDLAFSCATGRTFADVFTVARPLTVIYATGEGIGGLADRLRAVSQFYGTQDVPFYILTDVPQLFQHTQPNGTAAFLQEWQDMAADGLVPAAVDLFIVDTKHNATSGAKENDAGDDAIVQASMRKLRDTLGCAVLLVHHANKAGTSERGSSALRASMDTVLRSAKTGRDFTLTCEKLKDGEAWPAKSFDLVAVGDTGSVRVFWQGDAKRQEGDRRTQADRALEFLIENAGTKYTAAELANALGLHGAQAKNIYRDLKTLKLAGSVREEFTGKGAPALWYYPEDT